MGVRFCFGADTNGSSAQLHLFQPYHPPNVSEMRASIRNYNAMQVVLNEDQYGPLDNDSVIIVVQVKLVHRLDATLTSSIQTSSGRLFRYSSRKESRKIGQKIFSMFTWASQNCNQFTTYPYPNSKQKSFRNSFKMREHQTY